MASGGAYGEMPPSLPIVGDVRTILQGDYHTPRVAA